MHESEIPIPMIAGGRRRSAAAELTSPGAATLRLEALRDVTSRARQGGAGDTAGTQVGLLKLISASVLALVGRAQQQGRSGTAKSAFERRNVCAKSAV